MSINFMYNCKPDTSSFTIIVVIIIIFNIIFNFCIFKMIVVNFGTFDEKLVLK